MVSDSTDAAEVVAELTSRWRERYSAVAEFELKYTPGYLADVVVRRVGAGTPSFSVVGIGRELILEHHQPGLGGRWEILNDDAGRSQLERRVTATIERWT